MINNSPRYNPLYDIKVSISSKMIPPIIFLVLIFSFSFLKAQEIQLASLKSPINEYFNVEHPDPTLIKNIFFGGDTLTIPQTKRKLLPDNMSIMEKGLWGERGVLRSIGLAPELSPEVRKSELGLRRTMLSVHQISGFVTFGLMLATSYYGQKIIDGNRQYSDTKETLAGLTIGSYIFTGLLSILSPPPMIRRDDESSTTTLHKTLAWIHAAGMIITPILASYISSHREFNTDKAHVHQIAGYLTTAVFGLSLAVVTF